MAGTVSLHRHGNQSGGGWKGKSFGRVSIIVEGINSAHNRVLIHYTEKHGWSLCLSY